MNTKATVSSIALVEAYGSFSKTVAGITAVSRLLWKWGLSPSELYEFDPQLRGTWDRSRAQTLERQLLATGLDLGKDNRLATALLEHRMVAPLRSAGLRIAPVAAMPLVLARKLLGGVRDDADLRFYVMRSIRQRYHSVLSVRTMRLFSLIASVINESLQTLTPTEAYYKTSLGTLDDWKAAILADQGESSLQSDTKHVQEEVEEFLTYFLEVCRAIDFLGAPVQDKALWFRTASIDSEYMVSHVFGTTTNIPGLDQLFGGGGIIFPELHQRPRKSALGIDLEPLSGKSLVIVGQRGSGKSILAAQLAASVGKHGGVSWLMSFDQSPQECAYAFESFRTLGTTRYIRVAKNVISATLALGQANEDVGALILMSPTDPKAPRIPRYKEFLNQVLITASGLRDQKGLKLIVIDSIDGRLIGEKNPHSAEMRNETLRIIRTVKEMGTNLVLVVEEGSGGTGPREATSVPSTLSTLPFLEYVADVVIRLSVQQRFNYAQRYLEICKSRMQREQRGEHPFSILSGHGIQVYPSPAAVHARVRERRTAPVNKLTKFGVRDVDSILGDKGLYTSDIVALRGQSGSFKSVLGLCFLLSQEDGRPGIPDDCTSLLFTVGDSFDSVIHQLEYSYFPTSNMKGGPVCLAESVGRPTLSDRKQNCCLRVVTLPSGHISPGAILQRIEAEVDGIQHSGRRIHRLMIDNIAQLESSSPLVREDKTFPVTLLDFFRRQFFQTLLVCNECHREIEETLVDRIVGNSDCVLQFDRFEFRGLRRVALRVLQTRDMQHRLESFEVGVRGGLIELRPSSSLLRLRGPEGVVSPVPIRLFLHQESKMQDDYNQSIQSAISAVLSHRTRLDKQERLFVNKMLGVGQMSAVDELQLLQLDEFQLGLHCAEGGSGYFALFEFPGAWWDSGYWEELPKHLISNRILVKDHGGKKGRTGGVSVKSFHAVPYLVNVGLLAYRKSEFQDLPPSDWESISRCSWEWRNKRLENGNTLSGNPARLGGAANSTQCELFFDFPRGSDENFICLYLEILLSLTNRPCVSSGECALRTWLSSTEAMKAAGIFWELSHPAYESESKLNQKSSPGQPCDPVQFRSYFSVNRRAIVWRHWYSTLNQMFHEFQADGQVSPEFKGISVSFLPKGQSIAGEWYLAVPAYSAAPEAGLRLLKFLTSRDAELNRLQLGVGLPTRADFYSPASSDVLRSSVPVSPYFGLDVGELGTVLSKAFRRSDFGCYAEIAHVLSEQLRLIASIPAPIGCNSWDEEQLAVSEMIQHSMRSLRRNLDFVQNRAHVVCDNRHHELTAHCSKCGAHFSERGVRDGGGC